MTGPVVIEHDVAVMRDGTRLVADVYRPADNARHRALVHRTPYGRQRAQVSYITLDPVQLARAGFAVIVQDTRGRGDSDGGPFQPFAEGADGYDTVQWAAAQPWSDGKVGTYGSSYMGATTLQAAVETPPALATICAAQASCDYFEGRSYFGGAFEYGALVTTSLGAMLRVRWFGPGWNGRRRARRGGMSRPFSMGWRRCPSRSRLSDSWAAGRACSGG